MAHYWRISNVEKLLQRTRRRLNFNAFLFNYRPDNIKEQQSCQLTKTIFFQWRQALYDSSPARHLVKIPPNRAFTGDKRGIRLKETTRLATLRSIQPRSLLYISFASHTLFAVSIKTLCLCGCENIRTCLRRSGAN